MRILCVTNHFGPYQKGQHITDPVAIQAALDSPNRVNVVAIEVDDPKPAVFADSQAKL